MRRSTVTRSNASISVAGAHIVIAGGTQGIGEGIAYRFAKAGATVWIVGRNKSKANTVLSRLEEISKENKIDPSPGHHFIQADLSFVSEAKRVAEDIHTRAGPEGIDYLVLSQGGPPDGTFVPTSESHDQHYAVQVLSRFALAYLLASNPDPASSAVKKGVMSIMSPGRTMVATDYDDLELLKAKKRGKYGLRAMFSRDSNVVDAFTEELAERNPNVSFTHVYPGLVNTDVLKNSPPPWYLSAAMKLILPLAGCSAESYAEVPFYLLANPEGCAMAAKARYWNENVSRLNPGLSALDKTNREKVWTHLLEMLDLGK